jgi:hypothetical protein
VHRWAETKEPEPAGVFSREAVRPDAVTRPAQSLRTVYAFGDKATGTLPMTILGDSSREFMGFYCTRTSGAITITPTVGGGEARIEIDFMEPVFEMRLTSHGPMVQDEWIIDSPGGGTVTVIIIKKEGEQT